MSSGPHILYVCGLCKATPFPATNTGGPDLGDAVEGPGLAGAIERNGSFPLPSSKVLRDMLAAAA